MYRLWVQVKWPQWMKDEWEGEAGWALAAACRTYDETKGTFRRWLWVMCFRRVGELIRYTRNRGRNTVVVSESAFGGFDTLVTDGPTGEALEVYRRAKALDEEVVVERYENQNPLGEKLRWRHTRLIARLRGEL